MFLTASQHKIGLEDRRDTKKTSKGSSLNDVMLESL